MTDEWEPGEPFHASPNDPIVHGLRWRRERDEARAEIAHLREALEEIHSLYGGAKKAGCIAAGALLEVNHGERAK